jgi:hypothetical protein
VTKSNTYSPNWKRWHKAGFTSELLPIIPPGATLAVNTKIKAENVGKVPGVKNDDDTWNGYREWTGVHAQKARLKLWESWGAGIGMQGRQFPAVDVDVNDEQIAQTILMLALDVFGAAPIRYRDGSPRLLLMYSAKEGVPKRRIAFRMNDKDHVVEFLGRGQYYNVEGLHPKGQVYCWQESDGGVHPCDLKPSGLTEICEEKVTRFFDQVDELVQIMGGDIVDRSKGSNGERDPDAGKRVADEDDWVIDRCEYYLPYAPEVSQGLRDNTAVAVANRFFDWGAEQGTVEDLLARWNEEKCYPPLDNDDIKRIADSAMRSRHKAIGCDHWTTWSKGFEAYEMSPEQQAKHDKRQAEIDAMEDDANEEAERKARNVKTLSASTLMNMHFNPVNYIVPDVLVEGLTIFAGKPKIGKSWLLLHAANAIAEGGTTLGGLKCAEGDVLYCALEDNPRRLQSRMKALFGKSRKWSERLDFVTETLPRADSK